VCRLIWRLPWALEPTQNSLLIVVLSKDADGLDWLLNASQRYPLLTAKEEIIFARHVQAWRDQGDINQPTPKQQAVIRRGTRAYERFFQSNIRLAVDCAKKFTRVAGTQSIEDLVQEGLIGLQSAILKFDPSRGYKFSTYAYWWIKQGIIRAIERNSRTIRLPHGANQKIKAAVDFMREFKQTTGKLPQLQDVADHCNISLEYLEYYLTHNASILSLDEKVKDACDGSTYLELLADCSSHESMLNEYEFMTGPLQEALSHLPDKQREVIMSRYFHTLKEPPSYTTIAKEQGMKRQTAQEQHRRALQNLKQRLAPQLGLGGTPTQRCAA